MSDSKNEVKFHCINVLQNWFFCMFFERLEKLIKYSKYMYQASGHKPFLGSYIFIADHLMFYA